MNETFRLKIGAKRQATLPQRMLNLLHLAEGDELQVDVANNQIQTVRALKAVPTDLFTPEVLERLNQREAEINAGKAAKVDLADLRRAARTRAGSAAAR